MQLKNSSLKITTLFILLNIIAIGMLVSIIIRNTDSLYVNSTTATMGIALALINIGMSADVNRNYNIPLFILQFWSLFHVVFRIITLDYTEYSTPFKRSGCSYDSMNSFMLILITNMLLLWVGLHYGAKQMNFEKQFSIEYSPKQFRKVLKFWWFTIVIYIVAQTDFPLIKDIASLIISFLLSILQVLIIITIYFLGVWKKLTNHQRFEVAIALIAYAIFQTVGGSRGGFYSIVQILFFISLALGVRRIPIKYIMGGLLMLPIMVFTFVFSSYMRTLDMRSSTIVDKIELIPETMTYIGGLDKPKLWGPVFDRVGFLDMGAEMYIKQELLGQYITVPNEIKALIDGITPAFDVFDQAKASRMITAAYNYSPDVVVSRSRLTGLAYMSDELTIFGESILLFGIPLCFLFTLVLGITFKKIWIKFNNGNSLLDTIKKGMTIYMFYVLLSSFGIDWFFNDVVVMIISYIIFKKYVFGKSAN